MKNKRKIFVVGGSNNYANWMEGELTGKMIEADLVVFTGGEDVSPSLYGESAHRYTHFNIHRDLREQKVFEQAVGLKKHIIGICRGSQFSCVMSGGKLVQHQQNPSFLHDIFTYDGRELEITSTHHQAQFPWNLPKDEFKLLGFSVGLSSFHEDGNQKELLGAADRECEIVYYPKTRALAIQGHPEMMFESDYKRRDKTIEWLQALLDKHMNDSII